MRARELPAGTRLGGCEVVRLLGAGGMGAVYEARDATGRSVALKVLLDDAASDGSFKQRFVREARAAGAVAHPHVAQVHAAGEDGGRAFIVFELVRGGSLSQRIRERGALPWPEAVALASQIARGLEAIHAAGFVHRDLKPDNVLLDESGAAKVADLGLARSTGAGSRALTATGDVLGTPAYMAPEQIDHAQTADARADVYALGATLFALLSGRPPFDEKGTTQLLFKVLSSAPPRVSSLVRGLPPALDDLVDECLAKDPATRPATATEVVRRLEAIPAGVGGTGRRFPVKLAAGALGLALALAVVAAVRLRPAAKSAPAPSPSPTPDVAAFESRARTLLRQGKLDDAAAAATEGLALEPKRVRLLLLRSEALEHKDKARAIEDATSALALEPRSAEALARRAAARVDGRDWKGATADAEAALEIDPNGALAHLVIGEATLFGKREVEPYEGRVIVLEAVRRARRSDPGIARAWTLEAIVEHGRGKPRDVQMLVDEAIRRDPGNPWPHFLRGEMRLAAHDPAGAEAAYDEALDLDPQHGRTFAGRCVARKEQGKIEIALEDCLLAVKFAPDDPASWFASGLLRYDLGRLAEAIDDMKQAIERWNNKGDIGPWCIKADAELRLGRLQDALATAAAGIGIDEECAGLRLINARILARLDRREDALREYDRALEIARDPQDKAGRRLPPGDTEAADLEVKALRAKPR